MLFMQRIIATFSDVSLETKYNAVRVINHITLREYTVCSIAAEPYVAASHR